MNFSAGPFFEQLDRRKCHHHVSDGAELDDQVHRTSHVDLAKVPSIHSPENQPMLVNPPESGNPISSSTHGGSPFSLGDDVYFLFRGLAEPSNFQRKPRT
jgi:hypothetical protein